MLLKLLGAKKENRPTLIKFLSQDYNDHLKFTFMMSLIRVTYLASHKKLVAHLGKYASSAAGVLAGLWINIDPSQDRRRMLTMFMVGRATDIILNRVLQNAYSSKENEDLHDAG